MIVSEDVGIRYYDNKTGYGILTDGQYFWYTFWWEDKDNMNPPFENCMYIDYRTEQNGSQFKEFMNNFVQNHVNRSNIIEFL